MSAWSLLSLHVTISVSTAWAHSAASATLDTSCQDTAASVSQSELQQRVGIIYQPVTPCVLHFLDINECMRNVCPANKECRNTDGGYQCFDSCPAGMTKAENGACVGECLQLLMNDFIQKKATYTLTEVLKLCYCIKVK